MCQNMIGGRAFGRSDFSSWNLIFNISATCCSIIEQWIQKKGSLRITRSNLSRGNSTFFLIMRIYMANSDWLMNEKKANTETHGMSSITRNSTVRNGYIMWRKNLLRYWIRFYGRISTNQCNKQKKKKNKNEN